MENVIQDVQKEVYPNGGRAKINGWLRYTGFGGEVVEGHPEFVESYAEICRESERKKNAWVQWLRGYGVKAAHPNDGWHDVKNSMFSFSYPYFNDGVSVGDLVALGDYENFVVVSVLEVNKGLLAGKKYRYHNRAFKK